MADIDFGQLSEALNDKSDRDLRNVDTTAKADAVIDFQLPTADNGYTWYRKYKSGWVEQGQKITDGTSNITLPIAMANDFYTITTAQNGAQSGNVRRAAVSSQTTTGFYIENSNSEMRPMFWQVSGLSAN